MIAKIMQRWLAVKTARRADFVLLFNMGKVGSTAIESGFSNSLHTHTLYGNPPCPQYHLQKFGWFGVQARKILFYPLKRLLLRSRKQISIVTFYREPQLRNLSMFMQDLPFWLSHYVCLHPSSSRIEGKQFLLNVFMEDFPHQYPIFWLRAELGRFVGLDAKSLSLGKADYRIVIHGKYKIFIGRSERMEQCIAPLVEHFGLDSTAINQHGNRGEFKWYGSIYREFSTQVLAEQDVETHAQFKELNGYV